VIYTLLVLCSPDAGTVPVAAVRFAGAAIERGHRIRRVFFQDEGVRHGDALQVFPQDEVGITQLWTDLHARHEIDLVLCISSCLRRGLLDETESQRYEKSAATLHPAFTIGGLGQLLEAAAESDRLVTFGA